MKLVLLDAATLGQTSLEPLKTFGTLITYPSTTQGEILERAAGAQVILTNKVILEAAILAKLPDLRLICITATGMNNVDLAYAKERGIAVRNVAGYSTSSVAQHTLLLALALLGRLPHYHHYTQSGAWQKSAIFTNLEAEIHELEGKQWGIIGMGEIGRRVASIASALGAKVSYTSTSGANKAQPYPCLELEKLLSESDIISIHAPLNENTKNLLDESRLEKLQEGTILLNLGRGGIIDEAALARLMLKKTLWVGLDVLEREPMMENHPLLDERIRERVIITPHIAWGYSESRERLLAGVVKNISEAKSAGII